MNRVFMDLALKRAGRPDLLLVHATENHDFGVCQNEKLSSSGTQLRVSWLRRLRLLKPIPIK